MSIIPDFYLDSVVSLGTKNVDPITQEESYFSVGSGFVVFKRTDGELGHCFIVTNKHVIEDFKLMHARFNHKDGTSSEIELVLIDERGLRYSLHPDPDIDIAVIYINIEFFRSRQLDVKEVIIDIHSLKRNEMESAGLSEGSFIYSLGFPMNLIDIKKTPICRMGCISRIRDLYSNHQKKSYIIDTQVFPGNSGGPVLSRPEVISIEGTPSHNRCSIIGIVYAYIPYQETLISSQDNKPRSIVQENSGLALVHPVDYIFEVISLEITRVIL
jgi:S1-C subfamily serine protease